MTPDKESYAYAEIEEPGVTRAYDLLEGDPIMPTDFKHCNASSAAHYRWVMAANENWIEGTAPLNIYYQLNLVGQTTPSASGLFTVVEAYIAPGKAVADTSSLPVTAGLRMCHLRVIFATALGMIGGAITIRQRRK